MKNIIYSHFIILVIFSVSCQKQESILDNPKGVFTYDLEEIKIDSIHIKSVLLRESNLISTENYVVSINTDSDTLLRVFELPDFTYLGAFGLQGQGPEDFYYPNNSSFAYTPDGITLADLKTIRLLEFSKPEKTGRMELKEKNRIKKPGEMLVSNNDFFMTESIFCAVKNTDAKKHLQCYDEIMNSITDSIDFPEAPLNIPKSALYHLYGANLKLSFDKTKIAIVYSKFPKLDIVNLESGKVQTTNTLGAPEQKEIKASPNGRTVNSRELINYYKSIKVTSKYIYAIYQASEFYKLDEPDYLGNMITSRVLTSRELHIFDWEGQAIAKIPLKEWMGNFSPLFDDSGIIFTNPEFSDALFRLNLPDFGQ